MMPIEAVILIVASAFLHAGWNLIGKSRRPSAGYFLIATFIPALLLLPVIVRFLTVHPLPPGFYIFLAATATFQTIYFIGLAEAYRRGEMSVTYPLARAVPILILAFIEFGFQTGEPISEIGALAALIVVAGCLGVGLKKNGGLKHDRSLVFALVAAIGTAGYTLIDHRNMGLLSSGLGDVAGAFEIALFYISIETLITGVFLGLYVFAKRAERTAFRSLVRDHGRHAIGAGAVCALAYGLVLLAMPMITNATYVAAFRQLSIPIGAAAGVIILREPFTVRKTCSVVAIFGGLVLLFLSR